MFRKRATFPPVIQSDRFGPLRLEETRITKRVIARNYGPMHPLSMPVRSRPTVRQPGLTLCIWPPADGVPDPVIFADQVHKAYDAIIGNLDQVLANSHDVITASINEFWRIPGEPAPSTDQLLTKGELYRFNLSLRKGDDHELHIYDGGLLGGHDLVLSLGPDLRATGGYFDG